jgi:N-formylglutamate amidohydrolase
MMDITSPNVIEPVSDVPASAQDVGTAVFEVKRAAAPGPLVYACPHAGRDYPPQMLAAAALGVEAMRGSEDALVDVLIERTAVLGAAVISAKLARAYIDLNRDAFELDASMFEDELPAFAQGRTARVAAGLGSIARVVSQGRAIYGRKLTFAEALQRVEHGYRPYHAALASLIGEAKARHGFAILIDWHSMPAAAAAGQISRGGRGCDIVLGDRFGAACSPRLTAFVEREMEALGYRCTRNAPYAGGYTTEHYGRPTEGVHALQIEINRAIYLNEATRQPTTGFAQLKADIETLTSAAMAMDWGGLR